MPMRKVDLGFERGWLQADAAASIARLDQVTGEPWQITEAGRTYARQMEHWQKYQRDGHPIALHPDAPSIHQLGRAIDTNQRDVATLLDHGWKQTVYRNGVLVEPWHFEYDATRDNHLHDTTEDDTMFINIKGKKGVRRGGLYLVIGNKATFIGPRGKSAFPLFDNEREIKTLQSRISGLR